MPREDLSFPGNVSSKEPVSAGDRRDSGSILGSGRSPAGAHGNPSQYSCLENSMDRRAWWAIDHGITKCQTRLKQFSTQHREDLCPNNWSSYSVLPFCIPFQFSSVTQSCPTLCDSMNHSMPGLAVHHQHPEFTQTHVHRSRWCHPAISSSVVPSPPAFKLS